MQIGPPDKMRGTLRPSGIVFDNLALQSLRGYGLLIDSPRRATWDLGHRDLSTFSYKASGGGLQYYVFSGPDLPELLHTYLELTGYPPIPPRWALGCSSPAMDIATAPSWSLSPEPFATRSCPATR